MRRAQLYFHGVQSRIHNLAAVRVVRRLKLRHRWVTFLAQSRDRCGCHARKGLFSSALTTGWTSDAPLSVITIRWP